MSGPESTSESNKKSTRQGVNVPFVVFGAFGASFALMGSSAIAAETRLENTRPSFEGISEQAPKLALNPDGSVEVASTQHTVKPTSQPVFQPLPKQESTDWRVILNEDGTLSVVPVDEVPENATEVSCTEDGICSPVVDEGEEDTATADSMDADADEDATTADSMDADTDEDTTTADSTNIDAEADAEASPAADGPLFPRYDS